MGTVSLPAWLQIVQALAVPLIGAVIAAAGVWIAFQQMHVARVKLLHDLYDRRYAVFDAARKLIFEIISKREASDETYYRFAIGAADAPFLFDDNMTAYLVQIRDRASKLHSANSVADSRIPGNEKAAARKAGDEHFTWITAQLSDLTERFRPFLQLSKRNREPTRL